MTNHKYRVGRACVARPGPWAACLLAALGCLMLLGCGYQMAGSGSLPGGVRTLAVHTFKNRTRETNLGMTVTNAMITELNRRGKKVLTENQRPDAILTGTLISLDRRTISRSSENKTTERRVTIHIALTLTHADGRILWQKQDIEEDQAYAVNDVDTSATEAGLNSAIDQLVKRLAESVFRQLTENF